MDWVICTRAIICTNVCFEVAVVHLYEVIKHEIPEDAASEMIATN